jgi:hypothetical protein
MSILDEIKRDIKGAEVLSDWLGAGGQPVPQAQADGRALACMCGNDGRLCRHFVAPKWWERFLKHPVAKEIKSQLQVKHALKLSTPADGFGRMCAVCGCCVSLKVWVPIDHVKAHTTPEMMAEYPTYCWQRKEMTA